MSRRRPRSGRPPSSSRDSRRCPPAPAGRRGAARRWPRQPSRPRGRRSRGRRPRGRPREERPAGRRPWRARRRRRGRGRARVQARCGRRRPHGRPRRCAPPARRSGRRPRRHRERRPSRRARGAPRANAHPPGQPGDAEAARGSSSQPSGTGTSDASGTLTIPAKPPGEPRPRHGSPPAASPRRPPRPRLGARDVGRIRHRHVEAAGRDGQVDRVETRGAHPHERPPGGGRGLGHLGHDGDGSPLLDAHGSHRAGRYRPGRRARGR